jgi:hypothetical protein
MRLLLLLLLLLQPTKFPCPHAMDLLTFHPDYRVVVCYRCQCAIAPKSIARHLRTLHKEAEPLTNLEIRTYV